MKISEKLCGFNEIELKEQFENNQITFNKYYNLLLEYNLSPPYHKDIINWFISGKIIIDNYLYICEKYNYKIVISKEEAKYYDYDSRINILSYYDITIYDINEFIEDIKNNLDPIFHKSTINNYSSCFLKMCISKQNLECIKYIFENLFKYNTDILYETIDDVISTENYSIIKYYIKNGFDIHYKQDKYFDKIKQCTTFINRFKSFFK